MKTSPPSVYSSAEFSEPIIKMGVRGGGDASVLFPLLLSFLSSRDAGGLIWVVPGNLYHSDAAPLSCGQALVPTSQSLLMELQLEEAVLEERGPLQRWSEQCLKKQNLLLHPGSVAGVS